MGCEVLCGNVRGSGRNMEIPAIDQVMKQTMLLLDESVEKDHVISDPCRPWYVEPEN